MATNTSTGAAAPVSLKPQRRQHASHDPIEAMKTECDKAGQLDGSGIHKVISPYLKMGIEYYQDGRLQADRSFRWALIASGVGTVFFFVALVLMMEAGSTSKSTISLIAGGIIEVISGLNFYLYA